MQNDVGREKGTESNNYDFNKDKDNDNDHDLKDGQKSVSDRTGGEGKGTFNRRMEWARERG